VLDVNQVLVMHDNKPVGMVLGFNMTIDPHQRKMHGNLTRLNAQRESEKWVFDVDDIVTNQETDLMKSVIVYISNVKFFPNTFHVREK
jgi:hypothetical protein